VVVGGGFVGVLDGGWPVFGVPVGHSPRDGSQLAGDGFPVSTVRWHPASISAAIMVVMATRIPHLVKEGFAHSLA
jgi:hypothetical protein